MASATIRQLLHPTSANYDIQKFSSSPVVPCSLVFTSNYSSRFPRAVEFSGHRSPPSIPRAFPGKGGGSAAVEDEDDGVSLGTMKLPLDTDLPRFENLLFQWANSLCQGANLPLPVPLKVDKIPGGARLGFVTIGDEDQTEVLVYIDCVVFPAADGSGPLFRAIRNGPSKDQTPPGEPRIMRSLLQAIKKSAEIARV